MEKRAKKIPPENSAEFFFRNQELLELKLNANSHVAAKRRIPRVPVGGMNGVACVYFVRDIVECGKCAHVLAYKDIRHYV